MALLTGTQFLLAIFITPFLSWYIWQHWQHRKLYNLSNKVPGPSNIPLIGSAYKLIGEPSEVLNRILELFILYPNLGKVWFGNQLCYLVSKPEYMEVLLNTPAALESTQDNGVLVKANVVPSWKRHREIIDATFRSSLILNGYTDTIAQKALVLVKVLKSTCKNQKLDINRYLITCIVDMICDSIIDYPSEQEQVPDGKSLQFYEKWMNIIELSKIWYRFECIFKLNSTYEQHAEILAKMNSITRQMMEKKILTKKIADPYSRIKAPKKSFLQLLVEKYLEKDSLDIIEQANKFLLTGADKAATSCSFTLLLLALNPDEQERVYREIIEILGSERSTTFADLSKLQYTERAIKETLRLFPSVPFITRHVDEDVALDEYIIPQGSHLTFGIFSMHRNENYWPNPYKFDPDRFLPENCNNRHLYAWLPFSGGTRNCMGNKLTTMIIKILIALIVRKFKIVTEYENIEDVEVTMDVCLKPKHGFRIYLEPRTIN